MFRRIPIMYGINLKAGDKKHTCDLPWHHDAGEESEFYSDLEDCALRAAAKFVKYPRALIIYSAIKLFYSQIEKIIILFQKDNLQ